MLKYFVLLLISLTVYAAEPKFHFMDCVKITKGFYEGCKGNVIGYTPGSGSYQPHYMVEVNNCKGKDLTADFDDDQLEGCKK